MATVATFRANGHSYAVEGVTIPSTTQVLTLAGIDDVSKIPPHNLERAQTVGQAVHEACQFLDEEDLNLESIDTQIVGYVLAYQKFRQETCFESRLIEQRTIGQLGDMKYGMCVDRTGTFGDELTEYVIDLKTAYKPSPTWALQTAAYANGLGNFGDFRRAVVHLAKDGSYKLIRHEDTHDLEVFWSALEVAYWRLAHGIKIKD